MMDHSASAQTLAFGMLSGVLAFVFDSNFALVFAGFAGVLISLGLSGPRGTQAFFWVAAGTVSAAFLTPLVMFVLWQGTPPKAVAFLVGFAIMHFLPSALDTIRSLPGRIADRYFGGGS